MRYLHFQQKKMKIKSIILIGVSAAMIALPSCKKDKEESSTKEYLTGTLTFTMPTYVTKGEAFTLTPKGVTNPGTGSAEDVGFYWTSSWDSSKDTTKTETDKSGDGSYKFTTPSKVGKQSVAWLSPPVTTRHLTLPRSPSLIRRLTPQSREPTQNSTLFSPTRGTAAHTTRPLSTARLG